MCISMFLSNVFYTSLSAASLYSKSQTLVIFNLSTSKNPNSIQVLPNTTSSYIYPFFSADYSGAMFFI